MKNKIFYISTLVVALISFWFIISDKVQKIDLSITPKILFWFGEWILFILCICILISQIVKKVSYER